MAPARVQHSHHTTPAVSLRLSKLADMRTLLRALHTQARPISTQMPLPVICDTQLSSCCRPHQFFLQLLAAPV